MERYPVRAPRVALDEHHRRRDSAALTINLYIDFGHGVTGRIAAGPKALGVFNTACVRIGRRGNRGIGNQSGVLGPGGRGDRQGREDDKPGARSGEAAEPDHGAPAVASGHGAAARRPRGNRGRMGGARTAGTLRSGAR